MNLKGKPMLTRKCIVDKEVDMVYLTKEKLTNIDTPFWLK